MTVDQVHLKTSPIQQIKIPTPNYHDA